MNQYYLQKKPLFLTIGICLSKDFIDHGNGLFSKFMHLQDKSHLVPGDHVGLGDEIGKVGITGNAQGTDQPHLHWEIRQGGYDKNLNPSVDPTGCVK